MNGKLINERYRSGHEGNTRLLGETRAAMGIKHTNIVAVFDAREVEIGA